MTNFRRYLYGGMIGMIAEYLFRVKFDILPFALLAILLGAMIADLSQKKD